MVGPNTCPAHKTDRTSTTINKTKGTGRKWIYQKDGALIGKTKKSYTAMC